MDSAFSPRLLPTGWQRLIRGLQNRHSAPIPHFLLDSFSISSPWASLSDRFCFVQTLHRHLDCKFVEQKLKRTVEVFICHNGDLDFWDIAGVTCKYLSTQVRLCGTLNAACTQISLCAPSQAREHMHNDVNWNTNNTDQIWHSLSGPPIRRLLQWLTPRESPALLVSELGLLPIVMSFKHVSALS